MARSRDSSQLMREHSMDMQRAVPMAQAMAYFQFQIDMTAILQQHGIQHVRSLCS